MCEYSATVHFLIPAVLLLPWLRCMPRLARPSYSTCTRPALLSGGHAEQHVRHFVPSLALKHSTLSSTDDRVHILASDATDKH